MCCDDGRDEFDNCDDGDKGACEKSLGGCWDTVLSET